MKKFAVGFIDLNENELKIEIIEAEGWREASIQHSQSCWTCLVAPSPDEFEDPEDAENEVHTPIPKTIEDAKQEAFDMDGAFDCVEIPS